MNSKKDLFLLKTDVVYLNHGSFGATPKPVFHEYQNWQRILETQPVEFLSINLKEYLTQARNKLAEYIQCDPQNLLFIPNATFGVNMVSRGLQLSAVDEILTTNHEYGACIYTWEYICTRSGAKLKHAKIPTPFPPEDEIVQILVNETNHHTKLIFISHISSPTSLIFPAREICSKSRELNIPIFIDGAHAPGQIMVDINTLDPDFYVGNCHKWMMAPKGSAFLYVNPRVQKYLEPLVISWGYENIKNNSQDLADIYQWTGTYDPSAYLSIPSAIKFQDDNQWDQVQVACHDLAKYTLETMKNITGLPTIYSNESQYGQMISLSLPPINNLVDLKNCIYNNYKIEVPIIEWENNQFIRVSIQGYNDLSDINHLQEALKFLLNNF